MKISNILLRLSYLLHSLHLYIRFKGEVIIRQCDNDSQIKHTRYKNSMNDCQKSSLKHYNGLLFNNYIIISSQ